MKRSTCSFCLAVSTLAAGGCLRPSPGPSTVVVLLDASCSRVNLAAYADAWHQVTASLLPGDRLVLAHIAADVLEFRPDLDVRRVSVPALLDNPLKRKVRDEGFRAQLEAAYEKAVKASCSARTPLLDTFELVGQLFLADPTPVRRLTILSDMLEDSARIKFVSMALTRSVGARIVEDRRNGHALAKLGGVDVFVAGASADSSDKVREVRQFWEAYFTAAGANLVPEHYGPVLMGFQQH